MEAWANGDDLIPNKVMNGQFWGAIVVEKDQGPTGEGAWRRLFGICGS